MDIDTQILRPRAEHPVAHDLTGTSATTGRSVLALIGWVGLCLLAGAAGSIVSGPDEWYRALAKPSWNPPPSVFGPVWTTLYVLMGIAAWLVWRAPVSAQRRTALAWFVVQLALNTAWSWIFFGAHRLDLALAELVMLWLAIAWTMVMFTRVRSAAALLLVPYLCWVTFAGALNAAIWMLNS